MKMASSFTVLVVLVVLNLWNGYAYGDIEGGKAAIDVEDAALDTPIISSSVVSSRDHLTSTDVLSSSQTTPHTEATYSARDIHPSATVGDVASSSETKSAKVTPDPFSGTPVTVAIDWSSTVPVSSDPSLTSDEETVVVEGSTQENVASFLVESSETVISSLPSDASVSTSSPLVSSYSNILDSDEQPPEETSNQFKTLLQMSTQTNDSASSTYSTPGPDSTSSIMSSEPSAMDSQVHIYYSMSDAVDFTVGQMDSSASESLDRSQTTESSFVSTATSSIIASQSQSASFHSGATSPTDSLYSTTVEASDLLLVTDTPQQAGVESSPIYSAVSQMTSLVSSQDPMDTTTIVLSFSSDVSIPALHSQSGVYSIDSTVHEEISHIMTASASIYPSSSITPSLSISSERHSAESSDTELSTSAETTYVPHSPEVSSLSYTVSSEMDSGIGPTITTSTVLTRTMESKTEISSSISVFAEDLSTMTTTPFSSSSASEISTAKSEMFTTASEIHDTMPITVTTESTTPGQVSVTTAEPTSNELRAILIMEGDCQVITATSESKTLFVKAIQMKISEELEVDVNTVEVDEIQCGSVNVSLIITNVTNAEVEKKLIQAVQSGNFTITLMNGTTPVEFVANRIIVTDSPVRLHKPGKSDTKSNWDEEAMWLIIILVSSIIGGMTILLIVTLCIVNHRKKKYQQSFSLGVTPASVVRLEDFTLTRMDRPHHIYSTDGQLIVKMPNGSQNHRNTPRGNNGNVVRSYVHSNGHYALPVVDIEAFDSNLMRTPSTEQLVAKHMVSRELPGIDNPSFSSDDILDSGNESDRTSSEPKQETPEVSPLRMTSPAATSTPGGASQSADVDHVDGIPETGAQANNEISETSVNLASDNVIEQSEHNSSGDSACHSVEGTADSGRGVNLTGAGALAFTAEQQHAMLADLPPPPDFAAPPVPPPPPAVPQASLEGSESASDSGAASARQSDIESPASSELGGASSK